MVSCQTYRIVLMAFGLLMATTTLIHAGTTVPIEGTWLSARNHQVIEIKPDEEGYVGILLSSDNPEAKIGSRILQEIRWVDDAWRGQLYIAQRDRRLDATLEARNDLLTITVKLGPMRKKLQWSRVQ